MEDRQFRGGLIQISNIKLRRGINFASSFGLNLRRSNEKKIVREINKRRLIAINVKQSEYTLDLTGNLMNFVSKFLIFLLKRKNLEIFDLEASSLLLIKFDSFLKHCFYFHGIFLKENLVNT